MIITRLITSMLVVSSMFAFASDNEIDEIVVTAKPSENRAIQTALIQDAEIINRKLPTDMTQIVEDLPAVGVRVNSRGETVIRLRGSEERQTALFLDGAPLNIPWDGRVDVGSLPAGIVSRLTVRKSAAPIEYGPNAVLGAVEISSRSQCDAVICNARVEMANGGLKKAEAVIGGDQGNISVVGAYSRTARDGIRFPAGAAEEPTALPYSKTRDRIVNNTDFASNVVWGSFSHDLKHLDYRISIVAIDSRRGIAPEGHIDPTLDIPRYWRYPEWNFLQSTFNAQMQFFSHTELKVTSWFQDFKQTIEQYSDASFRSVRNSEQNWDTSWGTRIVLETPMSIADGRLVFNHRVAEHEQRSARPQPFQIGELESFSQHLTSLGGELDFYLPSRTRWSLGGSYDFVKTPETGGSAKQEPLGDWAAHTAFAVDVHDELSIAATIGRRTRFPTMREAYGVALGQFVLNPDLQAETALLLDVNIEWYPQQLPIEVSLTPWINQVTDTLSQKRFWMDGRRVRQRVNLIGSKGVGLDFNLQFNPQSHWSAILSGNLQNLRAKANLDGVRPYILQRPTRQWNLEFNYDISPTLSLRKVVRSIGGAKDENVQGEIINLGTSTRIDLSVFWNLESADGFSRIVYFRGSNLTDELTLPQLGLPEPGRTLSVGFTFES